MKNYRVLLIIFASILLLIPTAAPRAQAVSTSLTLGTISLIGTVDVSNLQQTSQSNTNTNQAPLHSQGQQAYDEAKAQAAQTGFVPADEAAKTVANEPSTSSPLTTTVGLILEGAQGASPNPCACTPPDGAVGAGPNHIFSMVNTAGIIYTKSGSLVRSTFGLDSFFGVPGASLSDPQVSFDAGSGRWFASIIDISTNQVLIAVSTSNDPTGTFNLYALTDGANLPDQPVTGTNDDKYVVSVNDFNSAGTSFLGVHYWVLNKSELVAGASTIHFATNTPDPNMFSLHPAQHLSSSTTFYLVTDCTGSCVPSPNSQTNTETVVSLTGVPPGTVTVSSTSFSIATSVIGPNAAQPGTRTLLVTNDNRVESVVWESNSLWASWNDACVPSGDSATRTCLRLVQATTSGATASKTQDFDFAASGQYYFYPAVTSFQGQLAVSFGTSSSNVFPSALVTGRASSDPLNTLEAPVTVRSGSAPDTSTRYGDYFGAATDPTPTAASTFWMEAEYRKDSTFQNWNTVISQVGAFASSGAFDFSVSLNPSSGSVVQGTGTTSTVTVGLVSGTSQSVALSTTVSPSGMGVSASVNPTNGTPTYTSTLTISTTTGTTTGTYTITVTGTSGSLSHSATYTLTVTTPPTGDFSISASPSSLTIHRTGSGSTTVTITSLNGFSGTVSLSTGTLPAGVTASFNPTSITVGSGGSGTSTLTFTSSGAPRGTFSITVTGTSGSLSHSTTITLTITKH
jgi:hypothetical protein